MTTADAAAPAVAAPYKASAYSWYVLSILFLVYVMNFADRQIVGILAEGIKRDLRLTDTELGFVTGPAIALFYATLGIPMAWLADRIHRVRFLTFCLLAWSGLTALGGLAHNFWQLSLTRVGVSIAEAGGTPISASVIGDYFPAQRRATALGIYSAATPTGVLVGFAFGGIIAEMFGWRGAMIAAGIPGIVLAILLTLTIREPIRGAADPGAKAPAAKLSLWATVAHLWKIREYRRMVLGSAGANMSVYILLAWAPAVALRTFEVTTAQVGIIMGAGFAILGATAQIGMGLIADWLNLKNRSLPVILIGAIQLLVVPLIAAMIVAPTFELFMLSVSLAYAAIIAYSAICFSVTQNYTPPELRASAAALMVLVFNLVGLAIGPPLVGFVSDLLTGQYGAASLRYALALVAMSSGVTGLLLIFWVAPAIRDREAGIAATPVPAR